MHKLTKPSPLRGSCAALKYLWVSNFHSANKATEQYKRTLRHLAAQEDKVSYKSLRATGAEDFSDLLKQIKRLYFAGDIDLMDAYVRFSVFDNPSLPLAVKNLRLATGKHRVINILTKPHLDLHDRVVRVYQGIITKGSEPDAVMNKEFNRLAAFIFLNMERADGILHIAETRHIVDTEAIAALLNTESIPTPLMEGAL